MKLTLNEIKRIMRGVIEICDNGEYYELNRFGKQGREHYASEASTAGLLLKAHASSSMNFDLLTNSKSFDFTYAASVGSSRRFYHFDVYVDGVLVEHFGEEKMWLCGGRVHVDLSKYDNIPYAKIMKYGYHRVTVWLPNLARTDIKDVTLDDGACFEPVAADMNILSFGDSITHGYDAQFPSNTYINRIARHFNANLVNMAIGAEMFVPEIVDSNLDFTPDAVTVAYGTNDWWKRTREELIEKCESFISSLAKVYPSIPKFILLPVWRGNWNSKSAAFGDNLSKAAEIVAGIAEKYNCRVINCWNFIPHHPAFYSPDVLHPNDAGFAEYAAGVIAEMDKVLK